MRNNIAVRSVLTRCCAVLDSDTIDEMRPHNDDPEGWEEPNKTIDMKQAEQVLAKYSGLARS